MHKVFWYKNLMVRNNFEYLGRGGIIAISGYLRSRSRVCGSVSSGIGQKSAADFCKPASSMMCWKFLEQLLTSQQ